MMLGFPSRSSMGTMSKFEILESMSKAGQQLAVIVKRNDDGRQLLVISYRTGKLLVVL